MLRRIWRDRGFGIAMLTFFALSLLLQWWAGWHEYVSEQTDHGFPIEVSEYVWQEIKSTMENWQSEFLQLFCQVALLTYLLWKGSPQSRDSDERAEAKLDRIIELVQQRGGGGGNDDSSTSGTPESHGP